VYRRGVTLVEEVAQASVHEAYWQHVERKLCGFEAMWRSRAEAAASRHLLIPLWLG